MHAGLRVIDPELAQEAWGDPDPLSDRERQVLRSAEEGQTSADIAAALGLSEGTVRNYLSEAISKLGVANRIEAARLARQKGWLDNPVRSGRPYSNGLTTRIPQPAKSRTFLVASFSRFTRAVAAISISA